MARSRVELFEQIRRDRQVGGLSVRELAENHHVHRRTVRQALASAVPPPRKAYAPRTRPAIDAYVEVIDSWLLADRDVPRKQRHPSRRAWQRLVAEHGAKCAQVTISRYVARRRIELGLDRVQVAVPQTHLPGAEAEADFGEFYATIAGGAGQGVDVRGAAFPFRPGVPCRIRYPGAGGLPGRARTGVRALGAVPAHGRHQQQPVNLKASAGFEPREQRT